jgi:hypothetical protein
MATSQSLFQPAPNPAGLLSGGVTSGDLGPNVVVSGNVASGALNGAIGGANDSIASGSVGSTNIGSGQIQNVNLASGTIARAANYAGVFFSGLWGFPLITEETISGARAVHVTQSGTLRVAMASVSGRMPAVGISFDNVLSGIPAIVYTQGAFQFTSGMNDFSGYLGKALFVGRSGQIVAQSGNWNSGGLNAASGQDLIQRVGLIINSGGCSISVNLDAVQNQIVGTTNFIDIFGRSFGL